MKGERTKAYVQKLKEKGLPYLDIRLYKGYDELFRYGYSNKGEVTGQERLYIYSATKPMTVACALRLVEEGKLSLDDEVAKYLPAYKNTFLWDENKQPIPTKQPMTVRHLFMMAGGFSYDHFFADVIKEKVAKTQGKADTLSIADAFIEMPLLFEPGHTFRYGVCHDILAAVVEKASGKRFSQCMDEVVFRPLGMRCSNFHGNPSEMYAQYNWTQCGAEEITPHNEFELGENYDSGGAGVASCVEDCTVFTLAMTNGGVGKNGYRFLKEETIESLHSTMFERAEVGGFYTCIQGKEYGYGLGVRIRTQDTEWGLPKGEFGWDGAAGTYMMSDPLHKITVVMGMHLRNWTQVFGGEHTKIVEQLYKDMQEEGLW